MDKITKVEKKLMKMAFSSGYKMCGLCGKKMKFNEKKALWNCKCGVTYTDR